MSADVDSLRESLRALGEEMHATSSRSEQQRRERDELVGRARASGMTWREISTVLGVTERTLIKAKKSAAR